MKNKKVLLVSYVYPPVSSPGAVRTEKMRKFLPKFGIEPYVLTCKNAYSIRMDQDRNLNDANVYSVNEWLPQKAAASKMKTGGNKISLFSLVAKILKMVMIPDRTISWHYPASRYGKELTKSKEIDAVWSTSPSITNHLIASNIARKCKIPHILDFRDLWTLEPTYSTNTSTIRKLIEKKIEVFLLRNTSFITVVSPVMKEELLEHYDWIKENQIKVIYNGYDLDDYSATDKFRIPVTDKYRLLYAGTFYGNERDPSTLFKAISELSTKKLISPDSFEFIIVGEENRFINELLIKFAIEKFVVFVGNKPFLESLAWMETADRLLVVTRKGHASRSEMTSKIFDYMGAKKPILTLTHAYYPIAKITEEAGGNVVEFDNVESMSDLLLTGMNNKKTLPGNSLNTLFSRNNLAKELSEIIKTSIANK